MESIATGVKALEDLLGFLPGIALQGAGSRPD
jgi:hypothetical protein